MTLAMHHPLSSYGSAGALVGTGVMTIGDEFGPMRAAGTAVYVGPHWDPGAKSAVLDWDNGMLANIDRFLARSDPFKLKVIDTAVPHHQVTSWIISGAPDPQLSTPSAVSVISELANHLSFPVGRILSAADISRRTYHSWKKQTSTQPRLASQSRLWTLKHFVGDLDNLLDSPSQWLIDPARLALFEAGEFAQLVQLAVEQVRPAYRDEANVTGYTGDDDLIVTGPSRTPVVRKAKPARAR